MASLSRVSLTQKGNSFTFDTGARAAGWGVTGLMDDFWLVFISNSTQGNCEELPAAAVALDHGGRSSGSVFSIV